MADAQQINDFLVDAFGRINKIEERAMTTGLGSAISITEIHIIEKIGLSEPARMSEIAHMTRANTENWRKFIKSLENLRFQMARFGSRSRALSLSQHENRDHSPGSRIISVCSALLGQYRIIEQERFASKFCVLTRRGFAVILDVLP